MNTYAIKGVAIGCFIKADTKAEAERILYAPLTELLKNHTKIWFEKI